MKADGDESTSLRQDEHTLVAIVPHHGIRRSADIEKVCSDISQRFRLGRNQLCELLRCLLVLGSF